MMIFKGRNRVTSGFRLAARPSHNGIDLVGDDEAIFTVRGSTVVFMGAVSKSAGGLTWQWGYYVRIDGNDGRKYYYCHLAAGSLRVRAGQRVQAGTALGTMGNTGYSFGAHTHFEVRNAYGTPIDPASYAGVRNAVGTYTDTESEDDNMKFLKVTSGKCEVFTAPNVNAVDKHYNGGRLTEGVCYQCRPGGRRLQRVQLGAHLRGGGAALRRGAGRPLPVGGAFPQATRSRPAWRRAEIRRSWKTAG